MAEDTAISWCDATFNSHRGCTKVSAGCAHCYAETLSGRNPGTLGVWGPNGTRVVAAESAWKQPLKWDRLANSGKLPDGSPNPDGRRPRVFCASLGDVFEDWKGVMVDAKGRPLIGSWLNQGSHRWEGADPDTFAHAPQGYRAVTMQDVRNRLFAMIDATPNLDWLLLTKRPQNIGGMMPPRDLGERSEGIAEGDYGYHHPDHAFRRPNVWLGTSCENQAAADERIPHLLKVPAAVRFLSCEPLLGPIEFSNVTRRSDGVAQLGKPALAGISWVIVGGESGPGHRPMQVEWADGIARQCQAAGVRFFCKQDSGPKAGQRGRLPLDLFDTKEFPSTEGRHG